MTEGGATGSDRPGILGAYCAEVERLAVTLCDLIDVAERHDDLGTAQDVEPVLALEPTLHRLTSCLERIRCRVVVEGTTDRVVDDATPAAAPITTQAAPAPDDVDWLDDPTLDEMCRSAVDSTIAEIVAALGRSRSEGPSPESAVGAEVGAAAGDAAEAVEAEPEVQAAAEVERRRCARPVITVVEPDQTLVALLDDVGRWASLHGTSDTMSIACLFTMLATSEQTGCLHLRRVDEHLRFVVSNGVVVATATTRSAREEFLGEILVEHDWLTPERRKELVDLAVAQRRPLGTVAVDEGDVTVEQLTEALHQQVYSRFARVLGDRTTAYAFVAADCQDVDGRIFVHAQDLVFEGELRSDWSADCDLV